MIAIAAISLAAYLVGSFSPAYLLTRFLKSVDIRTVGSGNAGTVNVFREVGPAAGLAVLGLDTFKGAAVVFAVAGLHLDDAAMFAAAMALVLGHNFPVFLGLRGGKGVAPVFGLSLAVLPGLTMLSLAFTLGAGLVTRNVVFSIAMGFVGLNVLTIYTGQDAAQIGLCLTLSAVVVATHFALSYREVFESLRQRGPWGLFEVE